jgi:hypothetical protein
MTPKEKAEELVNRFVEHTNVYNEVWGFEYYIDSAKQRALIAVDEMLIEYSSQCPKDSYEMERHLYWNEVKKEIENL